MIRVEPRAGRRSNRGVHLGELGELLVGQGQFPHDLQMPEGGPTLVGDLGHKLRPEVHAFGPHDGQNVPLPVLQVGGEIHQELQQVGLRARGEAGGLGRLLLRGAGLEEVVVGRLGPFLPFPPGPGARPFRAVVGRVGVQRKRQGPVQEPLHLVLAVLELVTPDAPRVEARGLQHIPRRRGKVGVVFEEVDVAQHVGDDEFVLHRGVGLQQKSVGGVGVDHQLIDPGKPVVVAGFHSVVSLAIPDVSTQQKGPTTNG